MGQTCSSTASISSIAAHYPVEAQSGIDPEKAPENLAIIEALAMGFLAILEIIRLVRSLALGSTLASQPCTHTRSGCSSGSRKSSLSAVAGKRRSSSRSSPLARSAAGDARSTIVARFRDQRPRLLSDPLSRLKKAHRSPRKEQAGF